MFLSGTISATLFYAVSEGEEIFDLSAGEVEILGNYNFVYDGAAKTPRITVKINGKVVPSEFYNVTYTNNVNAGIATITARQFRLMSANIQSR